MEDLVKYVSAGGGVGLLTLFVCLSYAGKIVWGRDLTRLERHCNEEIEAANKRYEEMKSDRDEWKDMCLALLRHAGKAVDIAKSVTND